MPQERYITVAEFAKAFDTRTLAQLGSDSGSVGTVDESNTILLNAIDRASADVQSFALRGGRYSVDDLLSLQTEDDWSLKGTVASLAIGYAHRRRGAAIPDDIQASIDRAEEMLKDLAAGSRVFNDTEAIAAGQPDNQIVSVRDRQNLSLVGDLPFFPDRNIREIP